MMNKALKPAIFLVCLLPLAMLTLGAFRNHLGANPIESITHETGEWALRFLLITLGMTPLQRVIKTGWPIRLRRMLGLYAFFYACLHFTTYLWLDQYFEWAEILIDIGKRPYITVGFFALVLLAPLAATSNKAMIQKLGRRWRPLHSLVYPTAVLALLHYVWLVKADLLEPAIYLTLLIGLLIYRLVAIIK